MLRLGRARGRGHFVKMVHNGIEYGDMQLICEAYLLLANCSGWSPPPMHDVFARWNKGALDSYLIEITRDILGFMDPETGKPMVDLILDTAGQRALASGPSSRPRQGIPLTLIAEAVFARCLSAQKDERVVAAKVLKGPTLGAHGPRGVGRRHREGTVRQQDRVVRPGLCPDGRAGKESKWEINRGGVALMWRGGCIIRSAFLEKIKDAFDHDTKLANLMLDPYFRGEIDGCQNGWRRAPSRRP